MTEGATTVAQPECCFAKADKPTRNYFWLGFLLGLPVYPLLIPWILLSIPEEWGEAYIRFYAEYIRMVMHVLGVQ